jgi:hypothetical protein
MPEDRAPLALLIMGAGAQMISWPEEFSASWRYSPDDDVIPQRISDSSSRLELGDDGKMIRRPDAVHRGGAGQVS